MSQMIFGLVNLFLSLERTVIVMLAGMLTS